MLLTWSLVGRSAPANGAKYGPKVPVRDYKTAGLHRAARFMVPQPSIGTARSPRLIVVSSERLRLSYVWGRESSGFNESESGIRGLQMEENSEGYRIIEVAPQNWGFHGVAG